MSSRGPGGDHVTISSSVSTGLALRVRSKVGTRCAVFGGMIDGPKLCELTAERHQGSVIILDLPALAAMV